MKPPKRILLHQPYPDTADFEWCYTDNQLNINSINSHMYIRSDVVFEVLEDYKKVTDLMDELNEDHITHCTSKEICTVYRDKECTGYPCPGYTYQ
jgi:hypothetical protein